MGAAPDAVFTFARDHAATEERIRAAGLSHVFLRSCMYAEYVPLFADAAGVIRGPAGDGRGAFVSRDDVADVAAAVLAAPEEHEGRTYDVTGPQALSLDEAAAIVVRGRGPRDRLRARDARAGARVAPPERGARLGDRGLGDLLRRAPGRRRSSRPSDTVQQILGRAPRALADVLREHPETMAHLRR